VTADLWPAGRAPGGPSRGYGPPADTPDEQIDPPGTYPIPPGRGRWRLGAHRRLFAPGPLEGTLITEIVDAKGRRLDQQFDSPAKLTFTVDGRHPSAKLIAELQTDVTAWRWDDQVGRDRLMFRGIVGQSEDQVTETGANVVTFTCHDYLAMLGRRFLTAPDPLVLLSYDQDTLVDILRDRASNATSAAGDSFDPGSYLPLTVWPAGPNGNPRPPSQIIRDRTYLGGQNLGEAVDNLAHVIDGFDYDCQPQESGVDRLRIFFPWQGEPRDIPLQYGSNISGFTRAVNSGDYANYWRVAGDAGDAASQLVADDWNADANDVGRLPVGLWMGAESAADVKDVLTLQQKAAGDLEFAGRVVANWTLQMRPGAYSYGNPNMGDTVPLLIRTGRLDVFTEIRVIGLAYGIGEDGDETVEITVGRPRATLGQYLTQSDRAVDALTRRNLTGGLGPDTARGLIAETVLGQRVTIPSGGVTVYPILDIVVPVETGRRYRITGYADGRTLGGGTTGNNLRIGINDGANPATYIFRAGAAPGGTWPDGTRLSGGGAHFYTAPDDHTHTFTLETQSISGPEQIFDPDEPLPANQPSGGAWLRVEDLGRISP
jgi:hypothetical protein